jgi:DNA-binding CsgD family transcriptional regulator
VGKTALLDAAATRAQAVGTRALHASGVEVEAGTSFSTLHQLLYPLRGCADWFTGSQHDVLSQVLDLAQAARLDPLVVARAVLYLLDEVAAKDPLLLLIDDVPWIDRASATVLGFVARRVSDDPIVFLATARTGAGGFFGQIGLPEREIKPLAEQPAAALLDTRYPDLAATVRRRLLDEAAGNPLALHELPVALTDRQRSGQDPLQVSLPLSRRLEATFAPAFETLPAPTRHMLLLAALEPDASPTTLVSAAQGRADVDDLEPARQAGLIHPATSHVWFRHPLTRSAIVQLSSPAERRAGHQALADVADVAGEPGRRASHLAEAAEGPDEAGAKVLEEVALSTWRRGGASSAVTALVRAAELSPQPANRSRRLVEAAYLANETGTLGLVTRLLTDARKADDVRFPAGMPSGPVFAAATAVYLLYGEGEVDGACRLLTRALKDVDTGESTNEWLDDILYTLLFVCVYADRPELWELLGRALSRFDPGNVTPLHLCYDAFTDPARTSETVREGLGRTFDALSTDAPPRCIVPVAYAALRVEALSDYRHLIRRMIDQESAGGAIGLVIAGLLLLSGDSYQHGQWDEVETLAREGLDLAAAHGYRLFEDHLLGYLALVTALRGNVDGTRTLTDKITTWAAPRGIGITQALARYARAIAALGQGDYEEAYVQTSRISPPGRFPPGVLDLVEAAVHTGRTDQARGHVTAAQQAGIARISPRIALMTAGAAALAANDEEADPLFEAALSLPEADRWPFEQARIQLAYGQWLRRTRDTSGARLQLRDAIETFDRLGAQPWATRARNELRAAGIATATTPNTHTAALTPQERQIAELAATGLTNKQIGERLFLSHRTVGAHLHRIFPKLGITSRAALGTALEKVTLDENLRAP